MMRTEKGRGTAEYTEGSRGISRQPQKKLRDIAMAGLIFATPEVTLQVKTGGTIDMIF